MFWCKLHGIRGRMNGFPQAVQLSESLELEKTEEVKQTWCCLLHALWWNHGNFAQCKGIRENFAKGIRIPGFWNPEYSSRNPESQLRLEVLLTNSGIRYLPAIRDPRLGIQNPRLSWIFLHEASNRWNRSSFRLKRTC